MILPVRQMPVARAAGKNKPAPQAARHPAGFALNSLDSSSEDRIFCSETAAALGGKCASANPVLIESGFALFSLCGRIFGRRTGIRFA
jgi:hypothetical protein